MSSLVKKTVNLFHLITTGLAALFFGFVSIGLIVSILQKRSETGQIEPLMLVIWLFLFIIFGYNLNAFMHNIKFFMAAKSSRETVDFRKPPDADKRP